VRRSPPPRRRRSLGVKTLLAAPARQHLAAVTPIRPPADLALGAVWDRPEGRTV
jgi:hypothetical protein